MNMPGYTAEASVYGTREHYQFVKNQNDRSVHGVIAQMGIGCSLCKGFCVIFGLAPPAECRVHCTNFGLCDRGN
jgi:hypothetical protein